MAILECKGSSLKVKWSHTVSAQSRPICAHEDGCANWRQPRATRLIQPNPATRPSQTIQNYPIAASALQLTLPNPYARNKNPQIIISVVH